MLRHIAWVLDEFLVSWYINKCASCILEFTWNFSTEDKILKPLLSLHMYFYVASISKFQEKQWKYIQTIKTTAQYTKL